MTRSPFPAYFIGKFLNMQTIEGTAIGHPCLRERGGVATHDWSDLREYRSLDEEPKNPIIES